MPHEDNYTVESAIKISTKNCALESFWVKRMNKNIDTSLETTSKGYLIAIVGVFIWAFTAIFIRYLK